MGTTIRFRRGTSSPTSGSGLTLGEPAFNSTNRTLHIGLGEGVTAAWVGAPITGASSDIGAGLTAAIPTASAVKDYVAVVGGGGGGNLTDGDKGDVRVTGSGATLTVESVGGIRIGSATGGTNSLVFGIDTLAVSTGDGNVAIGNYALDVNTTGFYNTAVGHNALSGITSQFRCTAIGWNALSQNTAPRNVAVGSGALQSNTTGTQNVAFGNNTLQNNTTGNNNMGIGAGCLAANTEGGGHVAIGAGALGNISATGSINLIGIGSDSGRFLPNGTTGLTGASRCIYIGAGVRGSTYNENNAIVIGDNIISNGSNTVLIGNTAMVSTTLNGLVYMSGGLSADGATLSGTVTAPTQPVGTNNTTLATTAFVQNEIVADTVTSFNGLTGAVQGVSAAVAGSGISVSGATGAVTITNTGVTRAVAGTGIGLDANTGTVTITNNGVTSFNGLTGAVSGVTLGGANTFTSLNTFDAGIRGLGATLSAGLLIDYTNTGPGPSPTWFNINTGIISRPKGSLNVSGGTFTSMIGVRANPIILQSQTDNPVFLYGSYNYVVRDNAADLSNYSLNSMAGSLSFTGHIHTLAESAITDWIRSSYNEIIIRSGTANKVAGIYAVPYFGDASVSKGITVGNFYGLMLDDMTVGHASSGKTANIQNWYQVWLGKGTTVGLGVIGSQRWGIYQTDSLNSNYFAGKLGIGTTATTESLNVIGNSYVSGRGDFVGGISVAGGITFNGSVSGTTATFSGAVQSEGGFRVGAGAISAKTIGYTLTSSDNGKILTFDSVSPLVCGVDTVAGVTGFSCTVIQLGIGSVRFAASGVNLNSFGGLTLAGQNAAASLVCYKTNTLNVAGNLIP